MAREPDHARSGARARNGSDGVGARCDRRRDRPPQRRLTRGAHATRALSDGQHPVRERVRFGAGQLRVRGHRDVAPHADTALHDRLREVIAGVRARGISGGDIVERRSHQRLVHRMAGHAVLALREREAVGLLGVRGGDAAHEQGHARRAQYRSFHGGLRRRMRPGWRCAHYKSNGGTRSSRSALHLIEAGLAASQRRATRAQALADVGPRPLPCAVARANLAHFAGTPLAIVSHRLAPGFYDIITACYAEPFTANP
ncbi:protein of unknown function [Burkholderia multivorans]